MELCRVTTSDGLLLDGTFERVNAPQPSLLLIHGTGSNFYSGGVLQTLAHQAVTDGFSVLRVNTRGHDLAASISGTKGPVKGGAAFENVLDCHDDITAWCEFLVSRRHSQIILIGHSLGGVKALFSQALAPHPAVAGVVGISPPRFVHQKFYADPRCDAFRSDFAKARQLVADHQPDSLLSVTQPLPMLITAAGYLEKYGPDDSLDYLRVLDQIAAPRLILVGGDSVEKNAAFADLPGVLESTAQRDPGFRYELLAGADINYRNDPSEPWRRICEWMEA